MGVGKPVSKTPGRASLRRLRVGVVAMVAQRLSVSRRIIDGSFFGARYIAACSLQVSARRARLRLSRGVGGLGPRKSRACRSLNTFEILLNTSKLHVSFL